MLPLQEYVDIKEYSSLKVGGKFRYFTVISKADELPSLYAIAYADGKYKNIPIFVLGGGSNIVFSDGVLDVIAIKIEIKGFEIINETSEFVDIKVGAGENWDKTVEKTVMMNLIGLESLSFIPGTVGASPVQNIGAYGSEVKDTILDIEVFDLKNKEFCKILNKDCKFGYRDSIFKNEEKGRYIIISVSYRLEKVFYKNSSEKVIGLEGLESAPSHVHQDFFRALLYPGVLKYFEEREILNPTLAQIRDAIIFIRNSKLPDPKVLPSVGSFFKNPIVESSVANKINIEYPSAKFFSVEENHTKIPAGWLIENAGLKGKSFGAVSVYDKNALVLVNNGNATSEDIKKARDEIIRIVKNKFGIVLEQEPETL